MCAIVAPGEKVVEQGNVVRTGVCQKGPLRFAEDRLDLVRSGESVVVVGPVAIHVLSDEVHRIRRNMRAVVLRHVERVVPIDKPLDDERASKVGVQALVQDRAEGHCVVPLGQCELVVSCKLLEVNRP